MSRKYRIHEFAERVGRCTSTIRRWEREGKISPKRHPSGHRYFDESDVRNILGGKTVKRKALKEDFPATKRVRPESVE